MRAGVDIIARVGGDEFVVALSDVKQPDAVAAVAQKIVAAIARPYHIESQEIHVTPSLGISIFPKDGEDIVTLVKNADRAMYRNEFELVYQSMIDLDSGQIVGAEAQIRWHHPEIGLIPPSRFISLAEESGLILPIGNWVLSTACE